MLSKRRRLEGNKYGTVLFRLQRLNQMVTQQLPFTQTWRIHSLFEVLNIMSFINLRRRYSFQIPLSKMKSLTISTISFLIKWFSHSYLRRTHNNLTLILAPLEQCHCMFYYECWYKTSLIFDLVDDYMVFLGLCISVFLGFGFYFGYGCAWNRVTLRVWVGK